MPKILIIDDEEAILDMYATILSGYTVITAKDGTDGLAKAKLEKPDLIYLDIIMPKTNGLDVLDKLKKDKDTVEIPVILLTNLPKEVTADKAKSLGAIDYFVKVETEPEELLKRTKKILGK
ncbi:MAG: response regulator [bacterium]